MRLLRRSVVPAISLAVVLSGLSAVAYPHVVGAAPAGAPQPFLGRPVPGHSLISRAGSPTVGAIGHSAAAASQALRSGVWTVDLTSRPTAIAGARPAVTGRGAWRQAEPGIELAAGTAGAVGRVQLSVSAGRSTHDPLTITLTRKDGRTAPAPVLVRIGQAALGSQFGADYAGRVRWAQQVGAGRSPLRTTVDSSHTTIFRAQAAAAATVFTATAGPISNTGTGNFAATPLAASSSWQVSDQTGSFTWSDAMRVPPPAAGPAPEVSVNYDSGSVDGETGSTNNQPSTVGEGWSLGAAGFIQRSYASCSQDGMPSSGDECWKTDNASLSLSGHSGTMVKDGTSGAWKLEGDDNTRIQHLTSCQNGTYDNDCWLLTTPDGTQYYFGRNQLPGWTTGKATTNSTWTVPVYGNNPGEPGYTGTFATEALTQAWRWNLDYVVDPHGNSEAFYYNAETNHYAQNATDSNATSYVRGGSLARIDYGMRAGSELSSLAPQRVVFDQANRCVSTTNCDSAHPANWPDVPWDQNCTAAPCTGLYSPTFFSTTMLARVHTQLLSGSTYTDVESWQLSHTFPDPGDGTSAALWLSAIGHTGLVGGSMTLPTITFASTSLQNRVWVTDGLAPLNKSRLLTITGEAGGKTTVSYSAPECTPTNLPTPQTDTMRCFQQWWTPQVTPPQPAQSDWFHKYVVTQVNANPTTSDTASTDETFYDYLGTPGWRYDNSPFTPDSQRTWSIWAGYSQVRVRHGDLNHPSQQQTTVDTYYQGLDGDRAGPSGGTKSVAVSASDTSSVPDSLWLAGQVREETVTNGLNGDRISNTINTPWASAVTADDGTHTARHLGEGDTVTRTALAAGGDRVTETKYGHDSYGRVTTVDDLGDTSTASDDRCTTTGYADNTAAWLMNYPDEVAIVGRTCSQAPTLPDDAISDIRTSYDSAAWGAAPTKGDATQVQAVKSYTGSTPNWLTNSVTTYDALGRPRTVTDPRTGSNRTTSTSYVPASGGPLSSMSVTNTLGWTSTTTYQAAWNEPLTVTDPNGKVTTITYDPLGRRSQVWLPDRPITSSPTVSYNYVVSNTAPSYVSTAAVNSGGTSTSYTIYDGLFRQRQTQQPSEGGGTIVTDTQYDNASQPIVSNAAYWANQINPSGTLFIPQSQQQIPSQTQTTYDGAGQVTKTTLVSLGIERFHTSYSYDGDHVDVTPPAGGTATSTYTDARGNETKLLQYHGPTPAGIADTTSYTYDHANRRIGMTDAGLDNWTWHYDTLGQLQVSTDPDTGTTTDHYDDAGRLTTVDTAARVTVNGQPATPVTLAFSYDALDRKTGEFSGSTSGPQLAAWSYDPVIAGVQVKGQPASSTRYVGSVAGTLGTAYTKAVIGYDADYRVTGSSVTIPATTTTGPLAGTYNTTFTYGPDGQLTSQKDQAEANLIGETLTYSYSVLGHNTALTGGTNGAGAYLTGTAYTHIGQLAQYLRPGPTNNYSTYGYDQATGAITEIKDVDTAGTASSTVADRVYTYDNSGDVTSATDSPSGQAVDAQCFGYDYLQRLTLAWAGTAAGQCGSQPASSANLGGPAPYWQAYHYDALGDRTSIVRYGTTAGAPNLTDTSIYPAPGAGVAQPHIPISVTHTSSNGVPATTTDSYAADPAGDTTTRPGERLSYTPDGMLDAVTAGTQSQSNVYDADGSLLLQTDPTGTTAYLGDSQLHRNTGASTATGIRIYTSASGTPVAERTGSSGFWLDTDRNGTVTVTVAVTSAGTVTRRHDDPFGRPRDPGTVSWIDNRDFLDQPTTSLTGLTHLGARDYDPILGRFVTADPVLDPASPQQDNGYSYANDNPVTLTDPSGLKPAGDKDDTDAGDWGNHHTCPSCTHPAPKWNPSDGWSDPIATIDTKQVMISYQVHVGRMCHVGWKCVKTETVSLYDVMHPPPGPKNYCGWMSFACTLIGYNQVRNCIASPSAGSCLSAAVALVSDVFFVGGVIKASTLVAAAARAASEGAGSVVDVVGETAAANVGEAEAAKVSVPQEDKTFQFGGAGRSGSGVKNFVGPKNAVVRGASRGRIFITDDQGRVIMDITPDRAKPVIPGQGFVAGEGRKMAPTQEHLDWIAELWGRNGNG
ncbi:MAG TPA: RHS repeat-associated core domain-containing protein [Jatrophihabitans sp.]|nr:RHS repeat-associated core domain-containing protein [Jatrophihabitans sp.]